MEAGKPLKVTARLDLRGMLCPLPVLRTRKYMQTQAPGALIEVLADDPASYIDFRHYCNHTGHEMVSWHEEKGEFKYLLRHKGK